MKLKISFVAVMIFAAAVLAQKSNPILLKVAYMESNDISAQIYNDGLINGPFYGGPSIEMQSNELVPVVGVQVPIADYDGNGIPDTIYSSIISRGNRQGQFEERNQITNRFWGFNPVPGYLVPESVQFAVSDDYNSWPNLWPDHPEYGSNVWNSFLGAGLFFSKESFFVMNDSEDEEFYINHGFLPNPADTNIKGVGITVKVRYIQQNNPYYKNILFRVYEITNNSIYNYENVFLGFIQGGVAGGGPSTTQEIVNYDGGTNCVYVKDIDNLGEIWNKVGIMGDALLESPGITGFNTIESFDLSNDIALNNDKEVWQRFTSGSVTLLPFPGNPDYLYSSNLFSLNSGETKRIAMAAVYGDTENELMINTLYANACWNRSFDFRDVDKSIVIQNLSKWQVVNNGSAITWTTAEPGGSISIYMNNIQDNILVEVESNLGNDGSYTISDFIQQDVPGNILIVHKNSEGKIIGCKLSAPVLFDSDNNSEKPFLLTDDKNLFSGHLEITDSYEFALRMISMENNPMTLEFYYDNYLFANFAVTSDTAIRKYNIDFSALPNKNYAAIEIRLSDEYHSASLNLTCYKSSFREQLSQDLIEYKSWYSENPVNVNLVNRNSVTGHKYRLTFDYSEAVLNQGRKLMMNVDDIQTSSRIMSNDTLSGDSESRIFDGLAFSCLNPDTELDNALSGFNPTKENYQYFISRFNYANNPSQDGIITPFDYRIEFFNAIADTSVADSLIRKKGTEIETTIVPEMPVNFKVKNITTDKYIDFVCKEIINAGSKQLNIYFKEKFNNKIERTWQAVINFPDAEAALLSGAYFYITTDPGITTLDTLIIDTQTLSADDLNTNFIKDYSLEQNYPNPFNPETTIKFAIPSDGQIKLSIYNILGQEIATLVNDFRIKGQYEVRFNASSLASGMYIYKINHGGFTQSKRMLLVK